MVKLNILHNIIKNMSIIIKIILNYIIENISFKFLAGTGHFASFDGITGEGGGGERLKPRRLQTRG